MADSKPTSVYVFVYTERWKPLAMNFVALNKEVLKWSRSDQVRNNVFSLNV